MTQIQAKQTEQSIVYDNEGQNQISDDSDKQKMPRIYKSRRQQMVRKKPQSLSTFQLWVTEIYKLKIKISDSDLQEKSIEISISPVQIQSIVNKVLLQTCQIHRELINQQIKAISDMGSIQNYYKIDCDVYGTGFNQSLSVQPQNSEGIKMPEGSGFKNRYSEQYYSFCVWIIYNHYCSLSDCNEQASQLAKMFRQSSENLFFKIFKQIQCKKMLGQQNIQQLNNELGLKNDPSFKSDDNFSQINKIVSMIDDYEIIKINELNILTIVNLIPRSLPNKQNCIIPNSDHRNQQPYTNILYWHVCSFQTTINSIIYESRQNMRKYVAFLKNFKKAIKILKGRLSKSGDIYASQNDVLVQQKQRKHYRRRLSCKLFNQQCLQNQIQINMDRERRLDDISIENQKTRSEQAEFVKNIDDRKIQKNIGINQHTNLKQRCQKSLNQLKKANLQLYEQKKKLANPKIKSNYKFKNSAFVQAAEHVQSITKLTTMLSHKNDENAQDQYQDFNEKKRRIQTQITEIKMQKNLKHEIVQQLKNNLNSIIKTQLPKQQQLANYLKISQKHEANRFKQKLLRQEQFDNYLKMAEKHEKMKNSQLNLHQFIQQNNFKNQDQQSQQNDETYLQKMEEEHSKNQKKKKKKKNKKKKAQKIGQQIEKIQQNQEKQGFYCKMKQIQIAEIIQTIKIDSQNRTKCFQISDEMLIAMQQRQQDIFDRYCCQQQKSISKTKGKSKKQKAS